MKLQELLRNIKPSTIEGNTNVEITGVNIDSRKIKDGHLFVAIKGTQVDGHQFIGKAIELGAKAILCEDTPPYYIICSENSDIKWAWYQLFAILSTTKQFLQTTPHQTQLN